ncbi:helix-turn-helix domain-containing protein [Candidatus Parcubacteria bacterium]|nr:helix-turn-helix domain-containing protein [Candidatus Parcubacteria bacterium]
MKAASDGKFGGKLRGAPQIGALLQAQRKARGLELREAAKLGRLPVGHLEALESGTEAGLPAPVYVEGMLRRYARVVDLDPQKLVDAFGEERRRVGELAGETDLDVLPTLPRQFRLVLTPRVITFVAAVALAVALGGYLWYQVSGLIEGPKLILESPAADIATAEQTLHFTGETEADARLTVNAREVYVDDAGRFGLNLDFNPGLQTIEFKATNRFGRSTTIIRRIFKRP